MVRRAQHYHVADYVGDMAQTNVDHRDQRQGAAGDEKHSLVQVRKSEAPGDRCTPARHLERDGDGGHHIHGTRAAENTGVALRTRESRQLLFRSVSDEMIRTYTLSTLKRMPPENPRGLAVISS